MAVVVAEVEGEAAQEAVGGAVGVVAVGIGLPNAAVNRLPRTGMMSTAALGVVEDSVAARGVLDEAAVEAVDEAVGDLAVRHRSAERK